MANPQDALEAVNAALNGPEPEDKEEEKTASEEDEDVEADESAAGKEDADAKPEGEKSEDDKPEEEKLEGEKSEGEKAPEKKPEDGKPADKQADKPAAEKPLDPVNDPIPAQVSERTRERITSLIDMVKTRDAELAQHRELFQAIESTGMQPDELGMMLRYARLVHSDKLEDRRAALQILQQEVRGLALQLGEVSVGVNLLDDHPDLKQKFAAGQITEEDAREIALARENARISRAAQARQQQEAQHIAQERSVAIAQLNELGVTLQAIDPLYAQKTAILAPQLKARMAQEPPSRWVALFRDEYLKLKLPAQPAMPAAASQPPVEKPQPLRPNRQPAGEGQKAPSSPLEALNSALESIRGA